MAGVSCPLPNVSRNSHAIVLSESTYHIKAYIKVMSASVTHCSRVTFIAYRWRWAGCPADRSVCPLNMESSNYKYRVDSLLQAVNSMIVDRVLPFKRLSGWSTPLVDKYGGNKSSSKRAHFATWAGGGAGSPYLINIQCRAHLRRQ